MFQQIYIPHPALQEFVNNIMIHELKVSATETQHTFSIPPLPEQCLFFYVKDRSESENASTKRKEKLSFAMISGPNLNRHSITPGRHHLMIKVGFQPGGLYRFLGIPLSELLGDTSFDAVDLLGNEINEVNEQLQQAVSIPKMILIIESFLLKYVYKLKPSLPIDKVLPLLIKEGGLIPIDHLSDQACLSIRQFERVFAQRIGLPPKHFSRLVRFARAWILKEQQPNISWIRIAYACGYFDQMHLIRDFQEFAGTNPSLIESDILESEAKFFIRFFH